MRTTLTATMTGVVGTLLALTALTALDGCGGHASRDARTHDDTPASYQAIETDRTRDRDADVADATAPRDVEVQQAYDRLRAERRARGELGTAGEAARSGGANAAGNGAVGGSSAGGQAGGDRVPGTDALGGANPADADPIPYAGSRSIDPAFPGVVLAPDRKDPARASANAAPGANAGGRAAPPTTTPADPSANQWLGQPPADGGANRLDQSTSTGDGR